MSAGAKSGGGGGGAWMWKRRSLDVERAESGQRGVCGRQHSLRFEGKVTDSQALLKPDL